MVADNAAAANAKHPSARKTRTPRLDTLRFRDAVIASFLLFLLSPVLLLIALAIRINTRGPILIRKYYRGLEGKRVRVHLFRTMRIDSESYAVFKQAPRDDPRITVVGRILRQTSLDTLPMIADVLSGRVAFIGPRLMLFAQWEHLSKYIDNGLTQAYQDYRPGLISPSSLSDFHDHEFVYNIKSYEDQICKDINYMRNRSIYLDLSLVIKLSIRFIFGRRGNYM